LVLEPKSSSCIDSHFTFCFFKSTAQLDLMPLFSVTNYFANSITFSAKPDPLNGILQGVAGGNGLGGYDPGIYYPRFIPNKGVKSKLEIDNSNVKLQRLGDGRYISLGTAVPYNPANPFFGKNLYTLTMKNGIKYTIDGFSGDLLTAADLNGNQLTYSENKIVSNSGVEVNFGRDGLGRINSVTDPAGKSITYSYTGDDLTGVTDREQNTTQFKYYTSRPHFMQEVIDPLGRSGLKVEYDEAGRMKRLIDPEGNPIELTYNPEESIQIIQDAYNFPTIYKYDSQGNIIQQTNAEGQSTALQYDGDNNLVQITDPNGSIATYGYNEFGDILWRTDPHAPNDPNPTTTRYTYDRYGQNTSVTLPSGAAFKTDYDSKGNLLAMKDENNKIIQAYTYDAKGNVTSETDTFGTTQYSTVASMPSATPNG
jgi:YD repeat-containing protein